MKASICIATYNSEKTIRRTLDSVVAQTFDDYEVVIIDDHSVDNTVNIISNEYCARDNRFKLFVNTTNVKWPYIDSFNKSYEYASGELLIRLDHDDVLLPDYLEYVVNYMDSHKDVDGCGSRLIFYAGKKYIDFDNIDESRLEDNYIINYNNWIGLFNNCPPGIFHLSGYCDSVYLFHNPGSCLRKEFYDREKPRCISYVAGDSIFWLQVMAKGGKVTIMDECKIIYMGQNTSLHWEYNKDEVENEFCYQKHNYFQYYYVAYFVYKALSLYDDNYPIKDNLVVGQLKPVILNTVSCFKDLLQKDNLYDKVDKEFKI